MQYVAGFLFSPDKTQVALIRKSKPEWQAGKLNGVGGKIEDWECAADAMVREFREETGAEVQNWRLFATLEGRIAAPWKVYFFTAIGNPILKSITDEPVDWYPVSYLAQLDLIPNLRWLIPLALDDSTAFNKAKA